MKKAIFLAGAMAAVYFAFKALGESFGNGFAGGHGAGNGFVGEDEVGNGFTNGGGGVKNGRFGHEGGNGFIAGDRGPEFEGTGVRGGFTEGAVL